VKQGRERERDSNRGCCRGFAVVTHPAISAGGETHDCRVTEFKGEEKKVILIHACECINIKCTRYTDVCVSKEGEETKLIASKLTELTPQGDVH